MVRIGHSLLALTLALATTTACKKKTVEPTAGSGSDTTLAGSAGSGSAGSGSAAMTGSGSAVGSGSDMAGSGSAAATGSGSDSGSAADGTSMANKGGNCPSLVFGATTTAKVEKDVVVVTVTSDDKDAVLAIQNRAKALIKEKADTTTKTAGGHDQKGTQGGVHGICPIYFSDGTGAATNDAKGTVVRLVPRAGTAEELKKKIDDRIAKSTEWLKTNVKEGDKGTTGGVGGGAGKHGSHHAGSGDSKGKERGTGTGSGTGGGSGGGSATK